MHFFILPNPKREQLGQSRPADILVLMWSLGRPAALDITVVHSLNSEHLFEASISADSSLEAAEKTKHAENDNNCEVFNWCCVLLAVIPYDAWGVEALTA